MDRASLAVVSCTRRIALALTRVAIVAVVVLLAAPEAGAEKAWVRGGLRLNLRSEAGTQYRIIGALETGDPVDVLGRQEGWTQVRMLETGLEGWMPAGYLETEPPPTLRLQQAEDQAASLLARLETSDAKIATLTARNKELTERDGAQRSDIERLIREASELRANKRWPEWVTGASVLAAGMVLGALLHRSSTRRPQPRIRL